MGFVGSAVFCGFCLAGGGGDRDESTRTKPRTGAVLAGGAFVADDGRGRGSASKPQNSLKKQT